MFFKHVIRKSGRNNPAPTQSQFLPCRTRLSCKSQIIFFVYNTYIHCRFTRTPCLATQCRIQNFLDVLYIRIQNQAFRIRKGFIGPFDLIICNVQIYAFFILKSGQISHILPSGIYLLLEFSNVCTLKISLFFLFGSGSGIT